jgi:long-chain-fatty-acid--CoA ligase ACSBG
MIEVLKKAATKHGDKHAFKIERTKDGKPDGEADKYGKVPPMEGKTVPPALPDEKWATWTYAEVLEDVRNVAKGFIALGLQRHDAVNIWGFNAPEWILAAHAAIWAGGKCAGLYPTDTDETAAYKIVQSGGAIIVVEDVSKLKKVQAGLEMNGQAKRVKAIVAYGFDPKTEGQTKIKLKGCGEVDVLSWQDLIEKGKKQEDAEMLNRHKDIKAGHCAFLIYTSGTTGNPKAVMISHDNIMFNSSTLLEINEHVGFGTKPEQERVLSYLPLSHVAGMCCDIVTNVIMCADKPAWITLYFARVYDLKAGSIKDRLQVARPTFFLGVPLVWEKIADKLRAIGASTTGVAKSLSTWAKDLALSNSKSKQLGQEEEASFFLPLALTALSKVKSELGLQECKYGCTGAAPIRVGTLEYFGSLGLGINEVYGMSESTGAVTASHPGVHQWGSCGFALPGVEVKVFKVDDKDFNIKTECKPAPSLEDTDELYMGELCFRGRSIMMGYMAQPDMGEDHVKEIQKKTAETIDSEGWLHSGDKAMITEKNMVKITGRFKELIIGEGGENIAPVPIEDHVKKCCDGIAEIMMVGDKRKYNVALVTLKAVGANGEVPGTDDLDAGAKRVNPDVKTISAAMKDETWIKTITDAIKSANDNGKVCANNAAKIQKFTILPTNFSEQGNELTPTKKLKRSIVTNSYANIIEKMYKVDGVYIEYTA